MTTPKELAPNLPIAVLVGWTGHVPSRTGIILFKNSFKLMIMAVCVWGNIAMAQPQSSGEDSSRLETILSWMAHLNYYFPLLNVRLLFVPDSERQVHILKELQVLEDLVHGARLAPGIGFNHLNCSRPECGGGSGGNCSTCF